MHIDIHIPRPGTVLLALAAVTGWTFYLNSGVPMAAPSVADVPAPVPVAALVSPPAPVTPTVVTPSVVPSTPIPVAPAVAPSVLAASLFSSSSESSEDNGLTEAEMKIKWVRAERDFLAEKEDILHAQLDGLKKQRDALGSSINPELEEQFRRSVETLTALVKDQNKAEQFLLTVYRQEWEAEERAMAASMSDSSGEVKIMWPVEPKEGISAYFLDPAYKARFGVDHYAIDIPVPQGTVVLAPADGIVSDVADHGLGYNHMEIDHGGYATGFGHISQFIVHEGQRVHAGDAIGYSGGMPGEPGGGKSTGPHLHFSVYIKGKPVNPLTYLPKYQQ